MDILSTCTIRPSLFSQTMSSFYAHLINGMSVRHIINVDPIGESNKTVCDMIAVVAPHIRPIIARYPEQPNFASAWKWCWSQAESPICLHLEDDWRLLRDISFEDVKAIFDKHPKLAALRLPYNASEKNRAKQWNLWFPWNGEYFECPKENYGGGAVAGHPTFFRIEFIKQVWPNLHENACPEKQIGGYENPIIRAILSRWKFGVYQKPNEPPAVQDIGREWREKQGFLKDGSYDFITWKRK